MRICAPVFCSGLFFGNCFDGKNSTVEPPWITWRVDSYKIRVFNLPAVWNVQGWAELTFSDFTQRTKLFKLKTEDSGPFPQLFHGGTLEEMKVINFGFFFFHAENDRSSVQVRMQFALRPGMQDGDAFGWDIKRLCIVIQCVVFRLCVDAWKVLLSRRWKAFKSLTKKLSCWPGS